MALIDRMKEARLKKGYTQQQVAEYIGVAKSTYTGYEKGNSEPSMLILQRIMECLGVDANYLLQDEMKSVYDNRATPDEMNGIKKYRALDEHGKQLVALVLDAEHTRCIAVDTEDMQQKIIPLYCSESKVSAGGGDELTDYERWRTVYVPDTPNSRRADFVLTVDGDSMEPKFSDGDHILVRSQPYVDYAQIGVFAADGKGFVKKFGGDRLISLNRAYDDILLTEESNVKCFGLVLGKTTIITGD